jgi:hypothetical protein
VRRRFQAATVEQGLDTPPGWDASTMRHQREVDTDLALRVAYIRSEMLGRSQRDISAMLRIRQSRLSEYERGFRQLPWWYIRRLRDFARCVMMDHWRDEWIFRMPTEQERARYGWRTVRHAFSEPRKQRQRRSYFADYPLEVPEPGPENRADPVARDARDAEG